ncbi:uncharacterized protein MYCFIDRAFT_200892 [Pseudocercospora fijiensis CIRAD86]|uniref:Uncharacterized protein n=1 Tax=Pseudocercospora fijiensis (strain CIRAD86) TaxID=383855 RepID=M3AI49_PSEFD|nr:uncharacterized protein MYCFIDRAFT_200892 [Pseudocercospora fijiensis CIRAD86]EME76883.1 hypothetical protein MYCFIDRAFT_200892 [Pseudocercospora fijiensis CIRAD86]
MASVSKQTAAAPACLRTPPKADLACRSTSAISLQIPWYSRLVGYGPRSDVMKASLDLNMASQEDDTNSCSDPLHANAAVEKLAEKVDGLLTGGLHGEFYESRTSSKNRHQQLSEMFELRQLFQEVKAGQEKILRTAAIREEQAAAAAAATTKSGGLSTNNIAAIEAVVQRLTADKFRDMSLLSQRLKDSEKENAALKKQIEDLEFRFKTRNISGLKGSFPSMNQHNQMMNKVSKLEHDMALCEAHRTTPNPLEARCSDMQNSLNYAFTCLEDLIKLDVKAEMKGLADKIAELDYRDEAVVASEKIDNDTAQVRTSVLGSIDYEDSFANEWDGLQCAGFFSSKGSDIEDSDSREGSEDEYVDYEDCSITKLSNMSSGTTSGDKETTTPKAMEEVEDIARAKLHSAVADALTEFTSRLGGGGFGDLRIEGSKANGHEELFKLREQLLKIQEDQARQLAINTRLVELKENPPLPTSQGSSKMSVNSTKAMESVVERVTEKKFRDLAIKLDSAVSRQDKAETENKKLKDELDDLKMKQKKGTRNTESDYSVSLGQHRDLSKKVEKLQKQENSTNDLRQQQKQLQSQLSLLQARFENGKHASSALDLLDVRDQFQDLRRDIRHLAEELQDLQQKLQNLQETVARQRRIFC